MSDKTDKTDDFKGQLYISLDQMKFITKFSSRLSTECSDEFFGGKPQNTDELLAKEHKALSAWKEKVSE